MNSIEITAAGFIKLLNEGIDSDKCYKIHEKIVLTGSALLRGAGATLIADEGVFIQGACGLTISDLTIDGDVEIDADSRDVAIYKCKISGNLCSAGTGCVIKANTLESINLLPYSQNCLVAQNNVKEDIKLDGSYNCSAILNSTSKLTAQESTNVYLIDNDVTDRITVTENKHLICDGNSFVSLINKGNTLINGDTVQNVDARLPVGADEDLLPHTNKDLFIGMERRLTVLDPAHADDLVLNEYIPSVAKENKVVIVPPGAYTVNGLLELGEAHSDTVIYAYGVYLEATDYIKCLQIKGVSKLQLRGITIGYTKQSAGQMQILEMLGDNKYLCISSAGFTREFGKLDPDRFSSGGYFFHPREEVSWTELGYWGHYDLIPNENGENINDDGTFVIEIINQDTSFDFISHLKKGEILTCRLPSKPSDRTASITDSTNVLLKDTTTYGFAGGLCFVIGGLSNGVKFYRHHNLSHSSYVIDKETYEKYRALEEKYGVDLEIYIDEKGRYRGSKPRIGSVDATHVTGSSKGLDAVHTLFENSCDDATNQNGNSSCLDKIIDNGDGTSTLIIKDSIPWVYYWLYQRRGSEDLQPGITARVFKAGNRMFAYASNGKVLCDTTVLTDAETIEEKRLLLETDYDFKGEKKHLRWFSKIQAVKVKTSDLNLSALDGIDPEKADYTMDNKVIVDNISRNSADFVFDNCMVRHNRGRLVIKTHNATIKNCTVKDTSYAGIVMSCECTWGESSVPCHVKVTNCLFDGASKTLNKDKDTKYAAIAVEGLGNGEADVVVSPDTLPAKDITVENNVFRNIRNDYCVTFSAVQGIKVRNNVFERRARGDSENIPGAIYVNGCMSVNISDNMYSTDVGSAVVAHNYKALGGSDVEKIFLKNS